MYIIHLGYSGFPIDNSATVQRIRLTFLGLKCQGFNTLIINKKSIHENPFPHKLNRIAGIPFIYTSYLTYRSKSLLIRNLNKLSGYIGEFVLLAKKRKKIHTAILYTSSFGQLIYYKFLSRLFNFFLIIQYVELRSSFSEGTKYSNKINNRLFDNYFYRFCDGVIAISDYLVKHVESKEKNLPVIKLPAICDFNEFHSVESIKSESYLMYCGNILYVEIVEFIIDIFDTLKKEEKYNGQLVLVIAGNHENWNKIHAKISKLQFGSQIIIKRHLPYMELISLYKGADVLMIPLRNTLQDNARFPHKIGEYSASKRPIISTNLGEVKAYFEDGVSAILADDFSSNSYVNKLATVLSCKTELDKIGEAGYKIGLKSFDYHGQSEDLKKFLLNLQS